MTKSNPKHPGVCASVLAAEKAKAAAKLDWCYATGPSHFEWLRARDEAFAIAQTLSKSDVCYAQPRGVHFHRHGIRVHLLGDKR